MDGQGCRDPEEVFHPPTDQRPRQAYWFPQRSCSGGSPSGVLVSCRSRTATLNRRGSASCTALPRDTAAFPHWTDWRVDRRAAVPPAPRGPRRPAGRGLAGARMARPSVPASEHAAGSRRVAVPVLFVVGRSLMRAQGRCRVPLLRLRSGGYGFGVVLRILTRRSFRIGGWRGRVSLHASSALGSG